jgi:hypothetical protein
VNVSISVLLQIDAEVIIEFLVLPDDGHQFLQPQVFNYESHFRDYLHHIRKVEFREFDLTDSPRRFALQRFAGALSIFPCELRA